MAALTLVAAFLKLLYSANSKKGISEIKLDKSILKKKKKLNK